MSSCFGCGDRRTVVGREGPVFAGLEFGGFFGVPHRVSIKKSASYGFQWNRIGNCGGSSHFKSYVRNGRNRPIAALRERQLTARSSPSSNDEFGLCWGFSSDRRHSNLTVCRGRIRRRCNVAIQVEPASSSMADSRVSR